MSNSDTIKKTLQVEDKFTKPLSDFKAGLKDVAKESDKADKEVDEFNDTTKKTGETSKKAGASLKTMAVAAGTTVVAVAGVVAIITKFINKTAEMADEIGKASQRMDVSIEFYQRMTSASQHAGTSITTVETAMRTMLRTMLQVDEGNERMAATYDSLGISIYDTNGEMRNQESLFRETMIALSEMQNHTERNALAQKLLGRSASQLAPLFNEGADAVRNYMNANDSAVTVSQEFADASARYNDSLLTIQESFTKVKNQALLPFMVGIANVTEDFEKFIGVVSGAGSLSDFIDEKAIADYDTAGKSIQQMEEDLKKFKDMADSAHDSVFDLNTTATQQGAILENKEVYEANIRLIESQIASKKRLAELGLDGSGGDEAETARLEKLRIDSQLRLESAMFDSMDKIRAEAVKNRLAREAEAVIQAENLLAIEHDSHVNRKKQRTEATAEELEEIKAVLEERRNMVAQSLTFANEMSSAMSTIHNSRMSELQREYDYEEERIKNSTMSRRKKEEALEELAEKRKKSDIESAKRQVFFASTQGVINVAMAIQNANLAVLGAMAQQQGGAFARIAGGLAVAGATVGAVASVVSASQAIPKREFGGVMRRNELYEVAERNKDEVFSSGGKSFMMPSQGGRAHPDVQSGGNTVVNMNVTFGAGTDTQTIEQRLPSMIAKGLEMADRQGEVRYERMGGFQKAIGN